MEKPWVPVEAAAIDLQERRTFALPRVTLGLRIFLAVATVLFSLLVVAYSERMVVPDWRPLSDPWLVWVNTAVLILSSASFEWARVAASRGRMDGIKVGLIAGGVCSFVFLVGQLLVWRQLVAAGHYASTNPANGFFYLMTGAHGIHLLGGLVAWARTCDKVWRGVEIGRLRLSVELCAVYWHFLLVVWLVLFGLLVFT
jgi:cytochrome c oxidase subunit 3